MQLLSNKISAEIVSWGFIAVSQSIINMKIVLIGDPAVGKTTLRKKYMGEGFKTNYMPTIGVDFSRNDISLGEKGLYQLQIWDLGSQALFQRIRKLYYASTDGALVLFDITNPISGANVSTWVNELWTSNNVGIVPTIILGNKVDLHDKRKNTADSQIGEQHAQKLSEITIPQVGCKVKYLETSAMTGHNVNKAFKLLIEDIITFYEHKKTA